MRVKLEKRLKPNPKRASELRCLLGDGHSFEFKKIWPTLKIAEASGSGPMEMLTTTLMEKYFSGIPFYIRGIISSESILTVPFELNSFVSIPILDANFYEFAEYKDSITDTNNIKVVNELEVGKMYEIIITNYCGLYRYRTHDVVKVVGYFKNTPTFEFVCRENVLLNLYAEKITEEMITYISKAIEVDINSKVTNLCFAIDDDTKRYEAFIELESNLSLLEINSLIEKHLIDNVSFYWQNIDCHKMKPLKTYILKNGSFNKYIEKKAKELNKSTNQIKYPKAIKNKQDRTFLINCSIY